MHRGPKFILKIYHKSISVHTPLNIQRSKLAKTMVTNAKFGSTCKSKVFLSL
jgi:hypothetical protein